MDLTVSNCPSVITSIDEKSSNANSRKRSVKSYATKVFQESTIGMVSSIVTTHSQYRRVFRTLLFLMCISGFLYQCVTFLNHVFSYPTTVDVEIKTPETYDIPAYTFCTNNPIKRSLFCSMYNDSCYKPSENFCKKFNSYCGTNATLIPKKQFYELEESMSHEDILKYGDDLKEFYIDKRSHIVNYEKPSGPYLRIKKDGFRGAMICYSLHSVVENNQQPTQKDKSQGFFKPATDVLTFYIDESEMFIPGNLPGVLFSIHSPYEAVNPFESGIFMKPGRTYKIYVEMKQEILLEEPFETDCEDYEETWKSNNHTGPRMQEMCQHKCFLDFSLEQINCVVPFILYPTEERLCDLEDFLRADIPSEKWEEVNQCWKNCRDDCKVTLYTPEVLERYEVDYDDSEALEKFKRYITVEVYLEDGEIMTLKHVPKYMALHLMPRLEDTTFAVALADTKIKRLAKLRKTEKFYSDFSLPIPRFKYSASFCVSGDITVEVFSNIGGFIGCWLGIALMDIIDVLASVFTVCRYAFKKRYRKL